jgi:hypothetical protein
MTKQVDNSIILLENPNVKGIRFMKNLKSQALHAGFAKAKVMSLSQWMLIYKIVLKKFRTIQYDYQSRFDLVEKETIRFCCC